MSDLQHEASALVASLHANSSVPYCIIPEIIQSVDNMIGMTVNKLLCETVVLSEAGRALQRQADTMTNHCSFYQHVISSTNLLIAYSCC